MSGVFLWRNDRPPRLHRASGNGGRMAARRTDPEARVMVFVDGQNVFKASERHFGRGQVHPILLARRLATGRRLVGTRYYSGIHDPHKRPDLHSTASRRHALMRRTGVTVVERKLRYRWEWGLGPIPLGPTDEHVGESLAVEATRTRDLARRASTSRLGSTWSTSHSAARWMSRSSFRLIPTSPRLHACFMR